MSVMKSKSILLANPFYWQIVDFWVGKSFAIRVLGDHLIHCLVARRDGFVSCGDGSGISGACVGVVGSGRLGGRGSSGGALGGGGGFRGGGRSWHNNTLKVWTAARVPAPRTIRALENFFKFAKLRCKRDATCKCKKQQHRAAEEQPRGSYELDGNKKVTLSGGKMRKI